MKNKVVASSNGSVGITAAHEILQTGGTSLDAVVTALSLVEANPDDHSVGYSGLPNMLGEVELDASVMVGIGLRAGSVGALRGYQDAALLSKHVMDSLPHVLIVGEGASRFASECGLDFCDLLTEEARTVWQSKMSSADPDRELDGFLERMREIVASIATDPQLVEPPHGTVNFICQDREGRIASGVSTSGWAWKYPGRVGDSPIIGAGNYCDDRYGAATCTGRGEMAQRACTAHSIVMFMRFGESVETSVRTALRDLGALDDPFASEMNVIALDAAGKPYAGSTASGKTYIYLEEGMSEFAEMDREHVAVDFD